MVDDLDAEILRRLALAKQREARLDQLLERSEEVVDTDALTSQIFKSIRNMRRWGYSDEKMAVRLTHEMKQDLISAAANALEMAADDIPHSRFPVNQADWLRARAAKLRRGE